MSRPQEPAASPGEAPSHPFGQPEAAAHAFVEHLALIDRLVQVVCRRKGILDSERDDFEGWVKLRLIQDDYRVFRRFRGESSLPGYLLTALLRLALDYCNQRYGRWRPSKAAQRSGDTAIRLETLLFRDGIPIEEAIRMLRQNHGVDASAAELRTLASTLRRAPRPRLEGEPTLVQLAASDRSDVRVEHADVAEAGERAMSSLRSALDRLPPEDLLIVRLLFEEGFGVADVARQLRLDQRRLYRRRDKILRDLRRDLERHGVDRDEVAELLRAGAWVDHLAPRDSVNRRPGPSFNVDNTSHEGEPR